MYKDKTICLILPSYNEETNIRNCIQKFTELDIFDEIIAVDNNSSDNTANEIKKTTAKYIFEKHQGYGMAIRTGISNSSCHYIVICEPDATFEATDIYRFLPFTNQFDCVFGTRTSKSTIGKGAKMPFYLRYGNILFGKILGYLFSGPTLTDVGCTYKLIKKESYDEIKNRLTITGSEFQPELMINLINNRNSIIEIPVNYYARKGTSKITYNFVSSLSLGFRMLYLILRLRIKFFFI
jgi:glycosyltransferase involved in cell wall biosynthesis